MNLLKHALLFFFLPMIFFSAGCSSKTAYRLETINVCVIPADKKNIEMEKIKIDLEKEAINKFMTKYSGYSIKDLVFVDRFYYSLKEMDKYCLKTKISVNTEKKKKKEKKLKIRNYCYYAGNEKITELEEKAVEEGLKAKINDLYPETKNADWQLLKKSVFDIKNTRPKFDFEKNSICLDITAKYYPNDIEMLTISKNFGRDKFVFTQDFKNTDPSKYGRNIINVKSGSEYGITAAAEKTAEAEFFAGKKENLEFTFHIAHKINKNAFANPLDIELLKIEYINGRQDRVKLISRKINSGIKCDIMVGRQKSQNMSISFEKNYNIFKIVKTKRQIEVWLNGKFSGAFLADGDIVNKLKFEIGSGTTLKHLEIKELDN